MANVNFHSQLASIMEVLANAAVAEICQLVDDGYSVLRLEISRTQRENLALKSKLRLMEVRSRDRFPRKSPLPHLVVSCGRKAVKHSSCAKRTTGPTLLGDLGSHPSGVGEQTVGSPDHPQVILVKEEDLGDADTQPNIGIPPSLLANDQTVDPSPLEEHRRPITRPPGPYRPASPPHPAQRQEEEAGDTSSSTGLRAGQTGGDRHGDAGQHTQPPYGRDGAILSSQMEEGQGGVDSSCSFPVEAEVMGSFSTEGPLGQQTRGDTSCGIVTPQTSLDWKAEDGLSGRVDPLKMEGGIHSAWAEAGRAFQTGLCLVPLPGRDREGVEMANSSASLASQTSQRGACDSAESRSSELDGAGFDSSSFDELFSSSDLSAVQVPHRDGGGVEGLPSYLFPTGGGGGFGGPADSSRARPAPERVLHCEQCGRLFHNARDLVVHQRSHAGERLFHCPQCKKPFLHLHQLKTHQRVHTGEKPFSCAQCGRRFSQSSHIKRHMSVHTGEKRYSCSLCGKRFSQACSLKVHQSVHTGERPYSCTQCGKSFSVLGNLVRHQSVHIRK